MADEPHDLTAERRRRAPKTDLDKALEAIARLRDPLVESQPSDEFHGRYVQGYFDALKLTEERFRMAILEKHDDLSLSTIFDAYEAMKDPSEKT